MKRTLLALALLLGSTGLFAQVGMVKADKQMQKKAVSQVERQTVKGKQVVQLSAKDGEAEVLCDFSDATAYTFGTNAAHTVSGFGWNLQPDTNTVFGPQGERLNTWLGIIDSDGNPADGWWMFDPARGFVNPTWANGFAYLDLLTIMNQNLNVGHMDAYVQLNSPIAAFGTNGVDITINQCLMRFNADRYFVEWSNDPSFTTYDSLEFNVKGIEMNANDTYYSNKRITLPNNTNFANAVGASADQLTYIRFRYISPSNAEQPHSYFWFIDDITYQESPENRVDIVKKEYCTGGYHTIPAIITPDTVIYAVTLENTGATDLTDAVLNNGFYSIEFATTEGGEDIYTQVSANVSEQVALLNTTDSVAESVSGSDTTWAARRAVSVMAMSNRLPSETPGSYAAISTITSSALEAPIALGDTTYFEVVEAAPELNGSYRWAKDRNFLVEQWGAFRYGLVKSGLNVYLTDEAAWNREGYEICLPYTTTGTVRDEEVYINGVEVVAHLDSCVAGAQIKAKLRKINWEASTYDELVEEVFDAWDVPVESEVYEVQPNDLNNGLCSDPQYLDVIGPDQFRSIYLPFKNSVELVPEETYYACYRMAANGRFMIGSDSPKVTNTFGPGTDYLNSLMLIFTPGLPASANYAWGGSFYFADYCDGKTPLIRMVIGDASTRSLSEEIAVASSLNAYPNPAANNATISYSLNKSGNVSIVITDLMGRVVMNMEEGNQTAGTTYTVNVNTANLANGTYFYTLNVNGEKQTKKFVVSK
jgi:hypothetical protein